MERGKSPQRQFKRTHTVGVTTARPAIKTGAEVWRICTSKARHL